MPLKLNIQFFAGKPPEPPKEPEPPKDPEPPKPSEEDMPKWANNFLTELKHVLKPQSTSVTTDTQPAQIPVPQPPSKPDEVEVDPVKPTEAPKKKTGFLDWLL